MTDYSTFDLEIFQTIDALNIAAAEFIITIADKAIIERGRFVISLSGGQTPEKLYDLLSKPPFRELVPWKNTFIFWGDERCVPLNDGRNNAHSAKLILLDHVEIPPSNIHPIPVNLSPEEAAKEYEREIDFFFEEKVPRFDLILLGLGENGHTASLFPNTKVVYEQFEGIREVYVEQEKIFRVTMTAPLINHAYHVLFLVTGEGKTKILKKVLDNSYQPHNYPAQLINPHGGELRWFVDQMAASLITD